MRKPTLQYWLKEIDTSLQDIENAQIRIGRALYHLRGEKHKKADHMWKKDKEIIGHPSEPKTFAEYCDWKWGFSRRRIDQLIKAYEVVKDIEEEDMGTPGSQTEEKILRPLGKLKKEERQKAWKMATEDAEREGVKVTSRHTRMAAQKVSNAKKEHWEGVDKAAKAFHKARRTKAELEQIEKNGITIAMAKMKVGKCITMLFLNENEKAKLYLARMLTDKIFEIYPKLMDEPIGF